jgi:polyferredoxin
LDQGWSRAQILRRVLRPRVPIKVDVIRDRGALARMVELGRIENAYRLQIINATEERQVVRLSASGLDGIELASEPLVEVLPTEVRTVAARIQVPPGADSGSHRIVLHLQSETDPTIRLDEKTTFLVPR